MDQKILDEIATASVASEKATGIPAAFVFAQCAQESGWLQHAPENNCFGVKSYVGEFGRQLLATKEWFTSVQLARFLAQGDGRSAVPDDVPPRGVVRRYTVKDWFATFATLSDCFTKRATLFTTGRYAPFAERYASDGDLDALVRGVASVYATDPNYASEVLAIANEEKVVDAIERARGENDAPVPAYVPEE